MKIDGTGNVHPCAKIALTLVNSNSEHELFTRTLSFMIRILTVKAPTMSNNLKCQDLMRIQGRVQEPPTFKYDKLKLVERALGHHDIRLSI